MSASSESCDIVESLGVDIVGPRSPGLKTAHATQSESRNRVTYEEGRRLRRDEPGSFEAAAIFWEDGGRSLAVPSGLSLVWLRQADAAERLGKVLREVFAVG